ncbi:uncharacterized protein MONBRDRAFT_34434 [Monosiga brevicollis MX1]|uniref:Alpha-L-rhamnosidase n=1 Tax=Monosiga brevicollis TaxID=81824 RepID=A9VBR6_MONBE|nr:uncharacterized protein MONBRDRAFT_34434 [Monosiga brevicollis MX1]EDQ85023.1 predicted protein [Monosiga brevicollis MX1]|eukprot:XP_001750193.1 hypothetical protein [Monosiga brevicollis MX1]
MKMMISSCSGRPPLVLIALLLVALAALRVGAGLVDQEQQVDPTWIWREAGSGPAATPVNVFTYFRTTFATPAAGADLTLMIRSPLNCVALPEEGLELWVAADSQAAVLINGAVVARKVTRYQETSITWDRYPVPSAALNATPGATNALVVRHHNWGDITCFQRTGQVQAGLIVNSNFGVVSDTTHWRWLATCSERQNRLLICFRPNHQAPEFLVHDTQVVGIAGGAHRIRFPQVTNMSAADPAIFMPAYDDAAWASPMAITSSAPWPALSQLNVSETTAAGQLQSGVVTAPQSLLAAGRLNFVPVNASAASIQSDMMTRDYQKNNTQTATLSSALAAGQPFVIESTTGGEDFYLTFDFAWPMHGYPQIMFADGTTAGVVIDLGYCEKALDLYSGSAYVNASGAINPQGTVGYYYADRVVTAASGEQLYEVPDERTLRWLTLHVRFPPQQPGKVVMHSVRVQSWIFLGGLTTAYFTSSNPVLNAVVNLSMAFIQMGMSDTFVDTPGREDGQWIEDARPRGLIAATWFNDSSLRQVLIRHQAEAQRPDGSMHPFPPSNFPASASADCCMNDIRVTPGCPSKAAACASGIVTPWIIERLRFSAVMASAVQQTTVAAQWTAAADRMQTAFLQHFVTHDNATGQAWIGAMAWLDGITQQWTPFGRLQAAHTVAIFTDLLPPSTQAAMMAYVFPSPDGTPPAEVQRWNNPTFLRRSLKALSHVNRTATALQHLIERFSQYLPGNDANPVPSDLQGPHGGPLPEYWLSRVDSHTAPGATDGAQPVDGTGSHGWTGVALEWIHAYVLGVRERWFKDVVVNPEDGGELSSFAGRTFTSWGAVELTWAVNNTIGALTVELPAGPNVTVSLPSSCPTRNVRVVQQPAQGTVFEPFVNGSGAVLTGAGTWMFVCS